MRMVRFFVLLVVLVVSVGYSDAGGRAESEDGLRWVDDRSGQVLFDVGDIVRFDWDKQVFELELRKAIGLTHMTGQVDPFTVRDGQGVIYKGARVHMMSCIQYFGPSITMLGGGSPPPFFMIVGWASLKKSGDKSGEELEDVRLSERLKKHLAAAGVLGVIELENRPMPANSVASAWVGEDKGLRVRSVVYPGTFRIGEEAIVCLYFVGKPGQDADVLEVTTVVTGNDGRFGCCMVQEFVLKDVLKDGWCVLSMKPWGPIYGSIEAYAEAGAGTVEMCIRTRKTLKKEPYVTKSAAIETLKIKPVDVAILPRAEMTLDAAIKEFQSERGRMGLRLEAGKKLMPYLKVGMSRVEVEKLLGKPGTKGSSETLSMYTIGYSQMIQINYDENGKVFHVEGPGIEFLSHYDRVWDFMRAGMTKRDVLSRLSGPSKMSDDGGKWQHFEELDSLKIWQYYNPSDRHLYIVTFDDKDKVIKLDKVEVEGD